MKAMIHMLRTDLDAQPDKVMPYMDRVAVEQLIEAYEALDTAVRAYLTGVRLGSENPCNTGGVPYGIGNGKRDMLEDTLRANDGIQEEPEYVQVGWLLCGASPDRKGQLYPLDRGHAGLCGDCEPVYVKRGEAPAGKRIPNWSWCPYMKTPHQSPDGYGCCGAHHSPLYIDPAQEKM